MPDHISPFVFEAKNGAFDILPRTTAPQDALPPGIYEIVIHPKGISVLLKSPQFEAAKMEFGDSAWIADEIICNYNRREHVTCGYLRGAPGAFIGRMPG